MNEKQRLMVMGMDMLLKKFSKYPDHQTFTVEEIIKASNEVYDTIMKEGDTGDKIS